MVVHHILKVSVEEAVLPYIRGIRMQGSTADCLVDIEIMLIFSDGQLVPDTLVLVQVHPPS